MWEITQNRNVLFGAGSLAMVGSLLTRFDVHRVLLTTYDGTCGAVRQCLESLSESGLDVWVDSSIQCEPDLAAVDALSAHAISLNADAILAVGGGSVMDAAKAAAMLVKNGGCAEDYQMNGRIAKLPSLPVVAVPTTAGTGSEASKVSVVYNPSNGLKKSIYSPYMIPDAVILDPAATIGLSPAVTASTGIDALSHAIESYVSLNAMPYTEMYGLHAIRLIEKSLVRCVENGADIESRGDLLLASYFAGCALQAGIGLAHILAQPLGGLMHIPHGEACSVFLPLSMEFNRDACLLKYCDIALALGAKAGQTDCDTADTGITLVRELIAKVKTPTNLERYVDVGNFDRELAVSTIYNATGHIKCNPRPVDENAVRWALNKVMP